MHRRSRSIYFARCYSGLTTVSVNPTTDSFKPPGFAPDADGQRRGRIMANSAPAASWRQHGWRTPTPPDLLTIRRDDDDPAVYASAAARAALRRNALTYEEWLVEDAQRQARRGKGAHR